MLAWNVLGVELAGRGGSDCRAVPDQARGMKDELLAPQKSQCYHKGFPRCCVEREGDLTEHSKTLHGAMV